MGVKNYFEESQTLKLTELNFVTFWMAKNNDKIWWQNMTSDKICWLPYKYKAGNVVKLNIESGKANDGFFSPTVLSP